MTDDTACVCAQCGHEQPTMDPCARCRSAHVVLVSVVRDAFGADWREGLPAHVDTMVKHTKRHVDQQAADYQPTRGTIDDPNRSGASSILRAVEKGGAITQETLATLLELFRTKTDYHVHVEVAVLPSGGALLKTIDNERDALETIRRLKAKP